MTNSREDRCQRYAPSLLTGAYGVSAPFVRMEPAGPPRGKIDGQLVRSRSVLRPLALIPDVFRIRRMSHFLQVHLDFVVALGVMQRYIRDWNR
jgi:hypothetical protein